MAEIRKIVDITFVNEFFDLLYSSPPAALMDPSPATGEQKDAKSHLPPESYTVVANALFMATGGIGMGFRHFERPAFHALPLVSAFKKFLRAANDTALFPKKGDQPFADYLADEEAWFKADSPEARKMVLLLAREYIALGRTDKDLLQRFYDYLLWICSGKKAEFRLMLRRSDIEREVNEIISELSQKRSKGRGEVSLDDVSRWGTFVGRMMMLFGVPMTREESYGWKTVDDVVLSVYEKLLLARRMKPEEHHDSPAYQVNYLILNSLHKALEYLRIGHRIFVLKFTRPDVSPSFNINPDFPLFDRPLAEKYLEVRQGVTEQENLLPEKRGAWEMARQFYLPLGPGMLDVLQAQRDYYAGLLGHGPLVPCRVWRPEDVYELMATLLPQVLGRILQKMILVNGREMVALAPAHLASMALVWENLFGLTIEREEIQKWNSFEDMGHTVVGRLFNPKLLNQRTRAYKMIELEWMALGMAIIRLEDQRRSRPVSAGETSTAGRGVLLSPNSDDDLTPKGSVALDLAERFVDDNQKPIPDPHIPLFHIIGAEVLAHSTSPGFQIVGVQSEDQRPVTIDHGPETQNHGSTGNSQSSMVHGHWSIASAKSFTPRSAVSFAFHVVR